MSEQQEEVLQLFGVDIPLVRGADGKLHTAVGTNLQRHSHRQQELFNLMQQMLQVRNKLFADAVGALDHMYTREHELEVKLANAESQIRMSKPWLDFVATFTGGQKQRMEVAAFSMNAPIISVTFQSDAFESVITRG